MAQAVTNLPANAGDTGSIPGSGISHAERDGNPLKSSCLGNPMDRGAWQATAHGVAKSRTQLSAQKAQISSSGPLGYTSVFCSKLP